MEQSETIAYLDREILKIKIYLLELANSHSNLELQENTHNKHIKKLLTKLEYEREIIMSKTDLR